MKAPAMRLCGAGVAAACWALAQAGRGAESTLDQPPAAGKAVYEQHCTACHGINGQGNGPAAVWLFPKPRNFSSGLFKIQSTPAGSLPTDDDLLQTLTRGLPGSSMPSFTYLTPAQRRGAVQYVKYLTAYADESGKRINRFEEAARKAQLAPPVTVPPEPPATLQSLTTGKELFTRLQCFTCHGETGAGDGPSAAALKDAWGLPLQPRDFNTGPFRGGSTGRDLYLRVNNGLAGTPMPPFGEGIMTPDQRWSLVHYVQSLRRKEIEINDILAPPDQFIRVQRLSEIPADPLSAEWEKLDPVRVKLNPLWPQPNVVPAVAIRAVHNGKRVGFLLQWRDPVPNGAPVRVQDFQDMAAIQFSSAPAPPFLGMGDTNNPVNLWVWKAGWQEEVDGKRPDVNTVYASMHVDLYPESRPLFRTAEAAGNLLAQPIRHSPVEDANAYGFGTLKSQSAAGQNVNGRGVWFDGHWHVLITRDFQSADAEDVIFSFEKPVQAAFAVWDGQNRDRNGRKVISQWYQLELQP